MSEMTLAGAGWGKASSSNTGARRSPPLCRLSLVVTKFQSLKSARSTVRIDSMFAPPDATVGTRNCRRGRVSSTNCNQAQQNENEVQRQLDQQRLDERAMPGP